MKLTMNIILDCLAAYKTRYRPGTQKDLWVDQIRLLGMDCSAVLPHALYVCTDKQLRRAKLKGTEQAAFVCVGGDGAVADRPAFREASFFLVDQEMQCLADLVNHLLECQALFNTWEQKLEEAILLQKDFQNLFDLCAPVFQNNLSLLWDHSYNLLAHSKAAPPNEHLRQIVDQGFFPKDVTDDFAQMGYMKNAMTYANLTFVNTPNYMNCPFILRTFVVGQRIQYATCLYFSASSPSQGMYDVFKWFCDRLAAYILHLASITHQRGSGRRSQCLIDLIENGDRGEEYLQDRAAVLGLKEKNIYQLCVVSFRDYTQEQALYMRMRVRSICGRIAASIYQENLVLLFSIGEKSLLDQEIWSERWQKMLELLPVCGARAAFSSALSSYRDMSVAYRQAQAAMKYGVRLHPEKLAYYYREYYIYDMIDSYSKRFPLEKMYVQKLSLLMDAKNYKSSNLYLLRTYLANERNISQTAKALYMHRNSVIYRVTRIRELLDMDFEDPDVRLRLLISFKILELVDQDTFHVDNETDDNGAETSEE